MLVTKNYLEEKNRIRSGQAGEKIERRIYTTTSKALIRVKDDCDKFYIVSHEQAMRKPCASQDTFVRTFVLRLFTEQVCPTWTNECRVDQFNRGTQEK